jgi:hypothetical protein
VGKVAQLGFATVNANTLLLTPIISSAEVQACEERAAATEASFTCGSINHLRAAYSAQRSEQLNIAEGPSKGKGDIFRREQLPV